MGIVSEPGGRGKGLAAVSRRDSSRDRGWTEGERGRHDRPESQESRGRHMPQSLRAQRSVARVDGRHTEGGLMRCRGGGLGGGPAGRRRRSADAPRDTPGTVRCPPPSRGARGGPPTRVGSKAAAGHGGKRPTPRELDRAPAVGDPFDWLKARNPKCRRRTKPPGCSCDDGP